jgi:hypothetical protein
MPTGTRMELERQTVGREAQMVPNSTRSMENNTAAAHYNSAVVAGALDTSLGEWEHYYANNPFAVAALKLNLPTEAALVQGDQQVGRSPERTANNMATAGIQGDSRMV